ncbi:MAG: hypothetical protein LAO03_07430 [Acidobacteriia bacterium]|nr:hypothetical protein [Terriglobia bacterium]
METKLHKTVLLLITIAVVVSTLGTTTARSETSQAADVLLLQSQAEADRKSAGCVTCHTSTDSASMHTTGTVRLGCTDCHGGNNEVRIAAGTAQNSPEYLQAKKQAHPQPRLAENANSSANPVCIYTGWLREDWDYVRFVNPGDLRVAEKTCGSSGCHTAEVRKVQTSMMTHGAMLWGAALYNNGAFPLKSPHFGESYAPDGTPQRLLTFPPPTTDEISKKGVLPFLDPLERWEISQPGNVLRVFERGGRKRPEVGNPGLEEDPGKPEIKLSERGFGTELRTDPVFLGLQKTRLLDPLLSFPGTNDQPGDYRASGCSACHVIYANDRSSEHSSQFAPYGNLGQSATQDPTIPHDQSGHPIRHQFTRSIPSSQCMVCHIHPGTNMVATYFGYTWWDNEMDGEHLWPAEQRHPSAEAQSEIQARNPERSSIRGRWSDLDFLEKTGTPDFNQQLQHTQLADFHSHGWIFRAVFKHDRKGNLLDADGHPVAFEDPEKFKKAVHLKDIHLEKGMHCIDCHFEQDSHGNGKLYGETRNAVEIDCVDCHGTIEQRANLISSGMAAPSGGTDLARLRTPWKARRFYWRDGRLYQRSMLNENQEWEVVQVLDTITPGQPHYNEKSRLAKTIQQDGQTWGDAPHDESKLAHQNSRMTCYTCHSSWAPTCYGCHLSMTANQRTPMLHNEGLTTRNWTSYNFQVLRDDMYALGIDGTVTGHRVAPVRSACAVLVSSQNADREWIYYQQQTISAEGFSGQAFSTFVPHTVRAKETKSCTDCHVSRANDNNAWMAQLLLQGANFMNFMGRYIFVADGKHGYEAVAVTEHDEPPVVIGSDFQKIAYPDDYKAHLENHQELKEAHRHAGSEVLDVQARGEYLYAAMGKGGLRIFDIANIDNKDISERMVTAPVSPLGQRFYLPTRYATAVATPTTLGVDPLRSHRKENEEQPIHLMYGFLYVADKYEGLVIVGDPNLKSKSPGVGTLLDGNPANNFLKRAMAFNPNGILNGARRITIAGTYAYVLCDRGLVVVDLNNPLQPKVTAEIGAPFLNTPRGIAVQFRYAFVVDREGLKVLDVTHLDQPKPVPDAVVALEDARNLYVARSYAYIAAGKQGLAIVDVEHPESPKLDQVFNANGAMNDANDVKLGMVSSSLFAYVADGKNGLRVVQLFSPSDDPAFGGFSPRPMPKLIAGYRTQGPALAISKGIDRDRAVDESGNQLAVFGRRGARPFNRQETERLYLRDGKLFTVTDEPPGAPRGSEKQAASDPR